MSKDASFYDSDYFLRGKETGKSLYSDYRWMPELTVPMARAIVEHCGITKGTGGSGVHRILDFGCARGYVVKALRQLGYEAFGADTSEWAIHNADEEVKKYLYGPNLGGLLEKTKFDWIIAKDVLEHVPYVALEVKSLMDRAAVGVFAVVPLSLHEHGEYVVDDYEKDASHIQRHELYTWAKMFMLPGWSVEASYRLPGVKDNYAQYSMGNGFLTARRIKE